MPNTVSGIIQDRITDISVIQNDRYSLATPTINATLNILSAP